MPKPIKPQDDPLYLRARAHVEAAREQLQDAYNTYMSLAVRGPLPGTTYDEGTSLQMAVVTQTTTLIHAIGMLSFILKTGPGAIDQAIKDLDRPDQDRR